MALINCPECDTSVSDKAENCPKCAFPLQEGSQKNKSKNETTVKAKEGCFLQTLNIGCFIVLIVLAIVAFFIFYVLV